jgi:hypothetical protein
MGLLGKVKNKVNDTKKSISVPHFDNPIKLPDPVRIAVPVHVDLPKVELPKIPQVPIHVSTPELPQVPKLETFQKLVKLPDIELPTIPKVQLPRMPKIPVNHTSNTHRTTVGTIKDTDLYVPIGA